jgi:hypothetical protein
VEYSEQIQTCFSFVSQRIAQGMKAVPLTKRDIDG